MYGVRAYPCTRMSWLGGISCNFSYFFCLNQRFWLRINLFYLLGADISRYSCHSFRRKSPPPTWFKAFPSPAKMSARWTGTSVTLPRKYGGILFPTNKGKRPKLGVGLVFRAQNGKGKIFDFFLAENAKGNSLVSQTFKTPSMRAHQAHCFKHNLGLWNQMWVCPCYPSTLPKFRSEFFWPDIDDLKTYGKFSSNSTTKKARIEAQKREKVYNS